ncbi:hypothetical protein HDV04_004546 [Boothiomyces sp. JEL0838]|nr:hypothetical protein HDV04_004546 [Boothiomyces sp. JEL0838]
MSEEKKADLAVDIEKHDLDLDDAELADAELANDWIEAVVMKEDDPNTPALTIRTLVLGTIWAIFLALANCLFTFRANPFVIPNALATLLAYPMGVFLAAVLPDVEIFGHSLNPGPFTVKEHALITIIASSAGGQPYGVDNVVGQHWDQFVGDRSITFWNSLPWILATQFIGYGVAGLTRRFLIKPAAMMWPSVLPTIALLNSFHEKPEETTESKRYTLSRYNFFWIIFAFIFIYEWMPLYFAPAFSMVSLLCILAGKNRTLKIFGSSGYQGGFGVLALTFDWTIATSTGPLYTPFWAGLNYFIGYIFWGWIIVPIVEYTNPFGVGSQSANPELGNLILSTVPWGDPDTSTDMVRMVNVAGIYNKNGTFTPIRRKADHTTILNTNSPPSIDMEFYEANKPFYLSSNFSICYFVSFINIASVLTHVFLWYGKDVYRQTMEAVKQVQSSEEDELNVRMRAYPEIPDWFYMSFLGVFTLLQVLSGLFTAFAMPWWSSIFAVILGTIYVIPIGIIQAISGNQIGLNVLTEFIIGLLTPGDFVGVMCFKSLGYNMVIQALNLASDLKLGHYMAIAPTSMFISQMIGTFIGAIGNLAVAFWAEDGLADQFHHNANAWDPRTSYGVFISAGGIWGAIGPARFFGKGSPYYSLLLGFPIGLVLPVLPWLANKVYPSKNWHLVNFPLLTQMNFTGQNLGFLTIPFILNIVFNKIIYTYNREWWNKYNFILSIALDSGAAVATLVITFMQFSITSPVGMGFFNPAQPANPVVDYYCYERQFNGSAAPGY